MQSYKLMLRHVALLLVVACSINVNMTLAQTIEKHLFGLNPFCDLLVLNFHIRSKFHYASGHISIDKTGIVNDVLPPQLTTGFSNRLGTSICPFSAALMKGKETCFFEVAPLFSNSQTTSTWLYSAATIRSYKHFLIEITT